jgi:hypothetical protein
MTLKSIEIGVCVCLMFMSCNLLPLDDPEIWITYTQHRKQSFHTIESGNKE